jgi:acyl-CoA thioesterase FadM
MLPDLHLDLPRHCFSPRQVARPGEIWRLCQQAAVADSARRGWPPERYLDEGTGFIVYGMTARHHREIRYGERVLARTWVRDFRRGILSRREVRLLGEAGPVASATQRWAHVSAALVPTRGSDDLIAAFTPTPTSEPEITLPEWEPCAPRELPELRFRCWQTWMDPLGHANHPAYLDWCDEALARAVAEAGRDPHDLGAVAERVTWKSGVVGGEEVIVETRLVGRCEGGAAFEHTVSGPGGDRRASAWTVRRLSGAQLAGVLEG